MIALRQKMGAKLQRLNQLLRFDVTYLVRSVAYLYAANIFSLFMGILLNMAFARIMGAWAFGEYGLVASVIGVLSVFTLTGMDAAITRSVAQGRDRVFITGMGEKLKFSILGSLGCLITAAYFTYVKADSKLATSFIVAALVFAPMNVFSSYGTFLVGRKMFKKLSLYSSIAMGVNMGSTILAIVLTRSFLTVMLTYLISQGTINTLLLLKTLQETRNDEMDDNAIPYGKHLSVVDFIGTIQFYIDNLFVAYFLSVPDLALYMVATAFPSQMKVFFKLLGNVMFPKMSALEERELHERLRPRLPFLLLGSLAMGVAAALVVPYLILLIYSRSYMGAVPYAQILCLGMAFGGMGQIFMQLLRAQKKTRALYFLGAVLPPVTWIFWIGGTLGFGLLGMSVARVLSWVLILVFAFWVSIPRGAPEAVEEQGEQIDSRCLGDTESLGGE